MKTMVLRFGPFEIDMVRGVLRKGRSIAKLRNQSLLVLTTLASRAGESLTLEELRQVVWGNQTFVDFQQGLRSCVKEIRACLRDDADEPRYIKTLPRVGYRFVAAVERVGAESTGGTPPSTGSKRLGAASVDYVTSDEPPVPVAV